MNNYLHHKGFSLVELVVYIGSMTVVLLAIAYMLSNAYGFYTSVLAGSRADRAAGTMMQVLATELRSGGAINQTQSIFNTPHGQLTIAAYNGTTEVSKEFGLLNNRVVLEVDNNSTYLTPADMQVTKLLFTQIVTPVSYAVRYELDLTYSVRGELVTKTYPGVVVLRRSYE